MIIDSHQHFWRLERGDYFWMSPDKKAIYRDFVPDDLRGHLAENGVDKTVLVQAADTVAETEFMLGLAAATDFVAGVVGWVALEQADAAAEIDRLREDPALVALRPMLQDIEDTDWILRGDVQPALAHLERSGLRFDALIQPRHLGVTLEMARRYPGLPMVVDHIAKPRMGPGIDPDQSWVQGMRDLAALPNVYCKLSGMVTEIGPDWKIGQLEGFAQVILEAFGAEKVMWGSDWPVAELATDYGTWVRTAQELTGGLSEAEQAAVFGGTARRFYGI